MTLRVKTVVELQKMRRERQEIEKENKKLEEEMKAIAMAISSTKETNSEKTKKLERELREFKKQQTLQRNRY